MPSLGDINMGQRHRQHQFDMPKQDTTRDRKGLAGTGELPGVPRVERRARCIHARLLDTSRGPSSAMANQWFAVYATAVNEENTACGRVVTVPTNGAAGVVPTLLRYAQTFVPNFDGEEVRIYLLTASAIGSIIKTNASISGAEVGFQGELGSASAMAAAGLAAGLGETPDQVKNAAQMALEHHLGKTCDPVAGPVQVPCIQRNAFGAVKAVTAASLALHSIGRQIVSLDAVMEILLSLLSRQWAPNRSIVLRHHAKRLKETFCKTLRKGENPWNCANSVIS
ncbi:L-serine ammonia-lyase, iron-sulfur-dependent, subunit alpha [Jannaschia rubra]|uniref:L-serine ammonia-lyase, iron-sulfur-dependent, subunit alpha n=1 Tax=Jannaschia rubra TaxID=282197 RepID=UPI0031EA7B2F